jgi:L-asparagine transporter-like permease
MRPESMEAQLKVAALSAVKLATPAATTTEQVSSTLSSATRQPVVDANIVYLVPLVALIIILPALYVIKNRSRKPTSLVVTCPNYT